MAGNGKTLTSAVLLSGVRGLFPRTFNCFDSVHYLLYQIGGRVIVVVVTNGDGWNPNMIKSSVATFATGRPASKTS